MQETMKLIIGVLFLLLGILVGIILAKQTKDESRKGQKWFKLIIFLSLAGGVVGLILQNDVIFFSFFFIAIVTSKSLKVNFNKKSLYTITK